MATGHQLLRGALRGRAENWERLRAALRQVTAAPSRQSESVLRALLGRDFQVRLETGSEAPHAMSAEDMLRSEAIQALSRWNRSRHRDVIAGAGRRSSSPLLAEIARAAQAKPRRKSKGHAKGR